MTATAANVFRALGDPTRLTMLGRLEPGRPSTVGSVSQGLGISRQGARKHLQVLVEAEVVRLEPKGRDVLVHLNPVAVDTGRAYLAELESRWDTRLAALKRLVEEPEG